MSHLAEDDAAAARRVIARLRDGAVGFVAEAADGATAVDADALARSGEAIALARARLRQVGEGGGLVVRGRIGDWRQRSGRLAIVGDIVAVLILLGQTGAGKAHREVFHLTLGEGQDVLGLAGRDGLRSLDLRDGQGAAAGDVKSEGRGLGRGLLAGGRGLLGLLGGNVQDVELPAGGGLDSGGQAWVMGTVVAVEDVIVPVALAGLELGRGEAEGGLPGARLGRRLVAGERELVDVAVPRADEVNSLDAGGNSDGERELDRHIVLYIISLLF